MELTPAQASDEWKAGKYRSVYLLVGEDATLRLNHSNELKARLKPDPFNVNEFGPEDADEAVSTALTPPVFSDRRLVVIRTGSIHPTAKKALAEYLSDPLDTTTLVLNSEERKPDLKDALMSAAGKAGALVVFRPMGEEEAADRLQAEAKKAGVTLDPEAADWIVEEAGTHWGILQAELKKLLTFAKGKTTVGKDEALACLGYRQAVSPFALANAIGERDRIKALTVLERLFQEGEDDIGLLRQVTGTVNRQLKAKRALAAGLDEYKAAGQLRMHPFAAKEAMRQARGMTETGLLRALSACVEVEANLKSKSWLDGRVEVGRLVAWLCRK